MIFDETKKLNQSDKIVSFCKERIKAEKGHWIKLADPITGVDWHHLFHLLMFSVYFNISDNESFKVIEYSGGFGNLALMASRVFSNVDYSILDSKDNINIQRIYLKNTNVKFIEDEGTEEIFDCFLSMWGLSELKTDKQKEIISHWYGAKQIMLAIQEASSIRGIENFIYTPSQLWGGQYVFGNL